MVRRQKDDDISGLARAAILLLGLVHASCAEEFGLSPPDDAGMDAPGTADAEIADVASGDDTSIDGAVSDVAVDGGLPVDGSTDSADRRDAALQDVASDAPRSDTSVSDTGSSDVDRVDGGAPEGGPINDAGGHADATHADAATGDAPVDARCTPESDAQFCARLGKTCETMTAADNCGASRSANCGTCASGMGCVDRVCKTPVCSSFTYSSAVYQPFSLASSSDYAIATSGAGESIVYAQSPAPDCSTAITYLADEITSGSRNYTSRSLAKWLDANKTTAQALSGDGLTLITLTTDFKTFQSARRSALQLTDFGTPSSADFDAVNAMLAGTMGSFRGGVISVDGLEFYFTIFSSGTASDGIYSAKRASTGSPFSAGARLIGIDSSYTDVTGVSSDRLALFVFKPWAGFVFTRSSTSADFSNPNAPNVPPQLAGWQHKPFADCATLLATSANAGGCGNEDVAFQIRR